jgi:hypothetical protein
MLNIIIYTYISNIKFSITQGGAGVQGFAISWLTVNPTNPGYSLVIIPISATVFKGKADVCGALGPRSGWKVLGLMIPPHTGWVA